MMNTLYENTACVRVSILHSSARHSTGTSTENVVVYRVLDPVEGDMGVLVLEHAAFHAMFKSVKWASGVPVYAILHQEIGKGLAASLADQIEAAIATKFMTSKKIVTSE